MKPWETLATVSTKEGPLELRKRGDKDFLLVIDGRVLMTSVTRKSEEELARLALAEVKTKTPRVLIGGLGMGFTLRAALNCSPGARITVAELDPNIVAWCKGPMASLTNNAAEDPRTTIHLGDVAALINRSKRQWDAIILDLYEGPHAATQVKEDPFYGPQALHRTAHALTTSGVFAVWSEDHDAAFKRRLEIQFDVRFHKIGEGGRQHVVYCATAKAATSPEKSREPSPPAKPRPSAKPSRGR